MVLLRSDKNITWGTRMAFVYRIGKKTIIRNQLHLIAYFKRILENAEWAIKQSDDQYRKLILEETDVEKENLQTAYKILDENERKNQIKTLTDEYWYRRLVNSQFFKQVYIMIKNGNYK